jgi:hypothetical protein
MSWNDWKDNGAKSYHQGQGSSWGKSAEERRAWRQYFELKNKYDDLEAESRRMKKEADATAEERREQERLEKQAKVAQDAALAAVEAILGKKVQRDAGSSGEGTARGRLLRELKPHESNESSDVGETTKNSALDTLLRAAKALKGRAPDAHKEKQRDGSRRRGRSTSTSSDKKRRKKDVKRKEKARAATPPSNKKKKRERSSSGTRSSRSPSRGGRRRGREKKRKQDTDSESQERRDRDRRGNRRGGEDGKRKPRALILPTRPREGDGDDPANAEDAANEKERKEAMAQIIAAILPETDQEEALQMGVKDDTEMKAVCTHIANKVQKTAIDTLLTVNNLATHGSKPTCLERLARHLAGL